MGKLGIHRPFKTQGKHCQHHDGKFDINVLHGNDHGYDHKQAHEVAG